MIVTRRRKKAFPWKRVVYPLAAVAVLVLLVTWSPTRGWLATSPVTTPVWNATAPVWKPLAKPFDSLAQQSTIGAQAAQIAELTRELNDAHSQISDRDKRISALTTQVNQAQQEAASAHSSRPVVQVAAAGGATPAATVANDLAQAGTPDMRRTAQVWAAMDSESAAKVVQRLPDSYVARVFALMSPDTVGAILENLPPAYAARLTQEHPELKR